LPAGEAFRDNIKNERDHAGSDRAIAHRLTPGMGPVVGYEGFHVMLTRLIPKVFFDTLDEGLDLFVNCLAFKVLYQDADLAVVERDTAKAYLVASPEFAAKDRPEIAIETDAIHELFQEISARRPEMLHPNSSQVHMRPWGALEFAVLDKTTVCVVFRQWG
jgi:hypothetical protein